MMKRTEKSIANSRQDKSRANSRQGKSKGLRPRQGEVRGEVHYRGKAAAIHPVSQPVSKHPRADANVQQVQKELKLDVVIRPSQRSTSTRKSWSTRRSSRQSVDLQEADKKLHSARLRTEN